MKNISRLLNIIIVLVIGSTVLIGQESSDPKNKKEDDPDISFGNVSPVILSSGGIEASTTHSLASYWVTSKFGNRTIDRYRISRLESNLNIQYGLSQNKRWDLGAQVKYGRIRIDENSRSSPFKVFSGPDASGSAYQGVTAVGLRARVTPFASNQDFTVQVSVFVPIAPDETTRAALSADRVQTDVTGTYFKALNNNNDLFVYVQGRYNLQLANQENKRTTHFPGVGVLLVKGVFDRKLFFFPGLSYTGAYQQNYTGGRLSKQADFLMASIGAQIQPIALLSIFINAQRPLIYNSGVSIYSDLVKNSYSDWALGLRVVL